MENMMRSLAQLMIDNAPTKFGIAADDVELITHPLQTADGDDHRRTITVRHLRTMESEEDTSFDLATSLWDGEVEWFLTVFEVRATCRQPAASRTKGEEYYQNEARRLADQVRAFFRGHRSAGRYVDRTAYDKPGTPAEGQGVVMWQRTDSQPEIPEDPVRTMVLTFEMIWWAPAPADN